MTVPGMNLGQARVVDQILTDHARGYTNARFAGSALFPAVSMPTRAAKRIEFDRSSFRRRVTRRAPGSRIAEAAFGYEGKPVQLTQEALRGVVPREHLQEAAAVPSIDLLQTSVDLVLAVIALEKEIQQAAVARNAALYADTNKVVLAGSDKWSDPDSEPRELVDDAKEVIRKRTGRRPNTLLLAAGVAAAAKRHPKIREHFRPTGSSSVSNEMLATYFDVEHVEVGDAIYDLDDETTVDVWGNDAVLAFVAPAGLRMMPTPSFGYTYQLLNHPFVEEAAWDNDVKSWCSDVTDEFSAELVGPDAGFLIKNAI